MFEEHITPVMPEISFEVLTVGEKNQLEITEKGKQRDVELR